MRLLLCLLFVCSWSAVAEPRTWHSEINQFAENIESDLGLFPTHGFNSTLWGAIQSYRIYDRSPGEFPEVKINSSAFATGGVKVGLKVQNAKRPLVVVMSGFGANLNTSLTRRSTYFFTSRGYHVMTVPNPWSTEFINSAPKERPGSVYFEAKTILNLIQTVQNRIGRNNIESTEIYAESYGAFLSSAMLGIDSRAKKPVIDGQVNLISPPFNIKQAFVNLDELLEMYHGEWNEICGGVLNSLHIARDNGLYSRSSDMSEFSVKCSPSLLIEKGFFEPLWASIYAVDKTYKLRKTPSWFWQHATFKSSLRFKKIFPEYLPEANELLKNPDHHQLSHWLSLIADHKRPKIHITYSVNDFLNRGLDEKTSDNLKSILSPIQITRLSWGGHMGYLSLPKWEETLDAVYGKPTTEYVHKLRFRWFGLD